MDEEAAKGQGEDWSLMVGYVQSCREKLPGAIEEWQKDGARAFGTASEEWPGQKLVRSSL